MSRLPIRVRLAGAFALAMALVLALAALLVYVRMKETLDDGIDGSLRSRADSLAALVERSGPAITPAEGSLAEPEEAFAQVLDQGGRVRGATGGAVTPALSAAEARRGARESFVLERAVPGVDGHARVLVRPAGGYATATGASLEDRDETLAELIATFAVGAPIAVLLASGVGYLLARSGLGPVESMRRRAEQVSLARSGERLPLPEARDELRRLGETLNEMLARLEAAFEREREFVADAGHELRTPLAALKTDVETALSERAGDDDRRDALTAALAEIDHLAQMAEDLLTAARSADGPLPLHREPTDVRALLEDTRRRFAQRARNEGREIRVEAPAGLSAELDPLRMRQALGNLVDNALRHGEGTVTLGAREGVEIEVRDEGPGIALGQAAFERFARGERTRGGSGLGLAIVRAIAEAHGGEAQIDGARVLISISAAPGTVLSMATKEAQR